ncbi:hypothetical protein SDC9_196491 [bioreactor metagenome]|uniref:Uncharacterized protein n=1 Tax=bioreactor metagenome TaxID=1076179 RepID=A0A645IEK1_9ZZZZ
MGFFVGVESSDISQIEFSCFSESTQKLAGFVLNHFCCFTIIDAHFFGNGHSQHPIGVIDQRIKTYGSRRR